MKINDDEFFEASGASAALRQVENSLRDAIQFTLRSTLGESWIESSGVTPDRLENWKFRAAQEAKKRGGVDPRLIYYADFYDLSTIIKKNWEKGISTIFPNLRELECLLKILGDLRNPDAHRRDFMPHEIHLAIGISGKIRSEITRHFSKMETSESYYPRIEMAQDNLGNNYSLGSGKSIETQSKLRPGDRLEFKIVGSDPQGQSVEYLVYPNSISTVNDIRTRGAQWNSHGNFSFDITEEYVGNSFWFVAATRSGRAHHAEREHLIGPIDDKVMFKYEVLPPRDVFSAPSED